MVQDIRQMEAAAAHEEGRLLARPKLPGGTAPAGLHRLELDVRRDGMLYVPPTYRPDRPAPLVLMLHGAGGNGRHGLGPLMPLADAAGLILLAPDARGQTWDVLLGGYGPDIDYIDRALSETFGRYAVDPAHLAVEGFSDGASYALSLGIANGDLFTDIIAFSPGFMAPESRRGRPKIFISHGTQDPTLGIEVTSRRIVPELRRAGYDVRYEEFVGGHTVPPHLAEQAVHWFLQTGSYGGDNG